MAGTASWLSGGYRLALWLCPPAFRRRFADELRHDFDDGLADAAGTGRRRDVPVFLARTAGDLVATVARQWLRTGGVVAGVVGLVGAGMTVTVAARLASSSRPWAQNVAPQDEELMTLMLMAGVVLFVVVAVIFLTQYLLWPRLRRGRG